MLFSSALVILLLAALGYPSSSNQYVRYGCFRDKPQRAIKHMIASYIGNPRAVSMCASLTKSKGFRTFGVQYNGQCFSASNAQHTFAKYGPAKNCKNGRGGTWANDVYFFVPRYVKLGCFRDRSNRAIGRMIANFPGDRFAIAKCAFLTKKRGFRAFGVQYNGQCFTAYNAHLTYGKYGSSNACAATGRGGTWANEVYFFAPRYVKQGCFKDSPSRAIAHMVANFPGDRFAVDKCAFLTQKRGFRAFGVQYNGQCFTASKAHLTFGKYGPSNACATTGRGGTWANQVYFLGYPLYSNQYVRYGCFRDKPRRAIKHMIASNIGNPRAVSMCASLTKSKGFRTFGVQYNGQCFSASNAQHTFAKYGTAKNCKNGRGGAWANDVYFFVPSYVKLGCFRDRSRRAIAHMVANFPGDRLAIAKCAFLTKIRGFRAFGVQYNGQCFTAYNADLTYANYGRSNACAATGRGGTWANEVYFLVRG